ncbi:MAG: Hpt domain-containing protein, partial [Verrucomicrobiota bacterium]
KMDGFAATRRIRELEREDGGHIPIIAMSARAMKGDEEMCLASGMDGYIAKPFRLDKLIEVLDAFSPPSELEKLEAAQPLAAEVESTEENELERSEGAEPAKAPARAGLTPPPFAYARYLKTLEADERTDVTEAAREFSRQAIRQMAQMDRALICKDWEELGRIAHSLRGSIGIFGDEDSVRIAGQIEDACAAVNTKTLPDDLYDLKERLNDLLAQMR